MIRKVGVLFLLIAFVLAPNAGYADVGKIADSETQKEIKEIKAMFADLQKVVDQQNKQLQNANSTISSLRKEVAAKSGSAVQATPQAVPTVGTGEITCGKGTRNLAIGGYMQLDYRHGEQVKAGEADTFDIRRLYLSFKGEVSDCVDYAVLLQMATSTSAHDVSVLNAFVTWKCIDVLALASGDFEGAYNPEARYLNLRAGSQLVPFGLEGSMSSSQLTMVERTMGDVLVQQHQLGLSAFGDFFDKKLAYSIGVYNNGYMNGLGGTESSDDNKMVAARITAVPFEGEVAGLESSLKLGSSWSYEDVNGGAIPTPVNIASLSRGTYNGQDMRMGLDAEVNIGDFRLRSEFIRVIMDPEGEGPTNDSSTFGKFSANAFYVEPSYFVIPDKLQVAYRWENISGDEYTDGPVDGIQAHVFGVNYFVTPYQKLMLNYAYSDNGTSDNAQNGKSQMLARYQICF